MAEQDMCKTKPVAGRDKFLKSSSRRVTLVLFRRFVNQLCVLVHFERTPLYVTLVGTGAGH